jgi:multidrug efflux pump subunit AcrA (membrane-fusion protein)
MADERDERGTDRRLDPEHELPWPQESDPQRIGDDFADPNALDDRRVGKNFEESQFSGKKHHKPLTERVHAAAPKKENRKPLYIFVAVFLVLFVLVLLFGWLSRRGDRADVQRRSEETKDAKPIVETAKVQGATAGAGLVVPGTTIPLTQAYVYARANGYLKKRYVDIGDRVREGQLLATIEAPDLDAQVIQAREQVAQAQQQLAQQQSQLALATVTVQRYRVLVQKGVFSRQDGDTQEANYGSQVANVAAAQRNVDAYKANLEHQIALQSYEQVRAPFAGVITERDVDVGALVSAAGGTSGAPAGAPQGQTSSTGGSTQAGQSNNAGASGSSSTAATSAQTPGQGGPLFGIAQVQRLRILVSVPEGYATAIRIGQKAPIEFQEYQNAHLFAEVTRTADSIDPNTRTMLTELQIDNTQGKLVAGMYAVVTFPPVPGTGGGALLISGNAIAIRHDLSEVATVSDGKIHFVPVTIGRDFGAAVEILSGLKPGDVIVTDVTDDVVEGAAVQAHETKGPEEQPQAPKQNAPPDTHLGGSTQYGDQGITDQNLQGQQQKSQQGKGQNSNGKKSSSESKP